LRVLFRLVLLVLFTAVLESDCDIFIQLFKPFGYYLHHLLEHPENYLPQRLCLIQTIFFVKLKVNSIISLNGVNCLVFIREKQLVYCVVRSEFS
jgi:hypothetical protein